MSTNLEVSNLSWNTTDSSLRNCFAEYGNILDDTVVRDRDTGRSRGHGFVALGEAEEAATAIKDLKEYELDGKKIHVKIVEKKAEASA